MPVRHYGDNQEVLGSIITGGNLFLLNLFRTSLHINLDNVVSVVLFREKLDYMEEKTNRPADCFLFSRQTL